MTEHRLVVDHLRFSYSGLLEVEEFYAFINKWFKEKGYEGREQISQDHLRPQGRYIELTYQPWKKINDYIRHVVKVRVRMRKLNDTIKEVDGHKFKLQEGTVDVTVDGYMETDYEDRWEQKPFYFFLRTTFDKFFYKSPDKENEAELAGTVRKFHIDAKAFLNLYAHRFGTKSEEPLLKHG